MQHMITRLLKLMILSVQCTAQQEPVGCNSWYDWLLRLRLAGTTGLLEAVRNSWDGSQVRRHTLSGSSSYCVRVQLPVDGLRRTGTLGVGLQ